MRSLFAVVIALLLAVVSSCDKQQEQPRSTTLLAIYNGDYQVMPLSYTFNSNGDIASLSSSYYFPVEAQVDDTVELSISIEGGSIPGGEVTEELSGDKFYLDGNSITFSLDGDQVAKYYTLTVVSDSGYSYPLVIKIGHYVTSMGVVGVSELTDPAVGFTMGCNLDTNSCHFQFANSSEESVTATLKLDLYDGNTILSILSNDNSLEDGLYSISNIDTVNNTLDVTMMDGKDENAAIFYITLTNIFGVDTQEVKLAISEFDGED